MVTPTSHIRDQDYPTPEEFDQALARIKAQLPFKLVVKTFLHVVGEYDDTFLYYGTAPLPILSIYPRYPFSGHLRFFTRPRYPAMVCGCAFTVLALDRCPQFVEQIKLQLGDMSLNQHTTMELLRREIEHFTLRFPYVEAFIHGFDGQPTAAHLTNEQRSTYELGQALAKRREC